MSLPKAGTVSTTNPHEPTAQALRDLAESTPLEDRRILLAALDALERSDTGVSVSVPANWERTIRRIPPEQHDERIRCISAIRAALNPHCETAPSSIPQNPFDILPGRMLLDLIPTLPSQSQASLAQTSREMRAAVRTYREELVTPFLEEPDLERLLAYFCPQPLSFGRIGAFESLKHDLLTKVVPDILEVLGRSDNLSAEEKETLCKNSPETIVNNPGLLRQVLEAAYDDSLVSFVTKGIDEPRFSFSDPQTVSTLKERARVTEAWLEANRPSVGRISQPFEHCVLCLPEEICALTNLSMLSLPKSSIRTLPRSIGNLRNLNWLCLTDSPLSSLPAEIGNFVELIHLYLSNNQLTALPAKIGNLRNLCVLDLSNNQLTALPEEIGNLRKLVALNLSNNQLTALSKGIGNFTRLLYLFFAGNKLTALPEEIGNLTKLKDFTLENNPLTDLTLQHLRSLGWLSV